MRTAPKRRVFFLSNNKRQLRNEAYASLTSAMLTKMILCKKKSREESSRCNNNSLLRFPLYTRSLSPALWFSRLGAETPSNEKRALSLLVPLVVFLLRASRRVYLEPRTEVGKKIDDDDTRQKTHQLTESRAEAKRWRYTGRAVVYTPTSMG